MEAKLSSHLQMYNEYKIKDLVNQTLNNVLKNVELLEERKKARLKDHEADVDEISKIFEELKMEEFKANGGDFENDKQEVEDEELARAHWIQLQKTNKQGITIRSIFLYMLDNYPHIRPVWHFGRRIDDREDNWKAEINDDFYFRHHCASIQGAITMVMENMDDEAGLRRLLNEIGAHHFYYDALEPHLEVFETSLIEGMKLVLNGPDALDEKIEASWNFLIRKMRTYMSEGIAMQRVNYMVQCLTTAEMGEILDTWEKVREYGFEEAGILLCDHSFKIYAELLHFHHLNMRLPTKAKRGTNSFLDMAQQIIMALNKVLHTYNKTDGFCGAIEVMDDYVVRLLVDDVCPTLVRKAFSTGLIKVVSTIIQKKEIEEDFVHTWSKLFRVMEQAMAVNIVNY